MRRYRRIKRIEFRIGIHVGDIIIDDNDIFGDGVNIAARLEGIAEPGGVCISDDAYRQIRGKVEIAFDDLGRRPSRTLPSQCERGGFSLLAKALRKRNGFARRPSSAARAARQALHRCAAFPEHERRSRAGIFRRRDGGGHHHGAVSFQGAVRHRPQFSFTYKGRAVDVKQVGRELGVRYVLEGSVRKAANRVRITGQLVDTATGAHLWADRFDGGLGDVFDLQDQVTESVVGAIAPAVEKAEIERAKRKPTESLDAYALYLRGLAKLYQFASRQANDEALRLFNSAIELDPDFASAYGRAAFCYVIAKANGWISVTPNEIAEVTRLAQRAVELGKDDAIALAAGG